MSRDTDFRGKPLHDNGWRYRGEFIEQYPIEKMADRLEELWAKGVLAIKWHQYVPAFNDGEPCEFTQDDVKVTCNPEVVAAWLEDRYYDGPDENDPYDDFDEGYILSSRPDYHRDGLISPEYDTPFDDVHFRYAVEAEFGVNVTVVVTPTDTYLFEYYCGY